MDKTATTSSPTSLPAKEEIWRQIEENQLKIQITNVGNGTPRYNSVLAIDEQTILLPFGAAFGEFELKTGERRNVFRFNKGAIFVLLEDKQFIYSIGFDGEICKIKKKTYELVAQIQTKGSHVRHASLNDEFIAISCEENCGFCELNYEIIEIFQIKNLEPYHHIIGYYYFGLFIPNNRLVLLESRWLEGVQWNDQDQHDQERSLMVFDVKEQKIIEQGIALKGKQSLVMALASQRYTAYLFNNRTVAIFSSETNKIVFEGPIDGQGVITSIDFTNEVLTIVPNPKTIMTVDLSNEKHLKNLQKLECLKEDVSDTVVSRKYESSQLASRASHTSWIEFQKTILQFHDGISVFNIQTQKLDFKLEQNSLTFCGTEIMADLGLAVIGDMGGYLRFYKFTGKHQDSKSIEAFKEVYVEKSIRCLCYVKGSQKLLFGSFDGELIEMDLKEGKEFTWQQIFNLEKTITSIRFSSVNSKIIATTVAGTVFMYNVDSSANITASIQQKCHYPVESGVDRKQFGSLHLSADIWNSEWSPCGKYFITCSEDQMAQIFEVREKDFLHIQDLTGHSFACTAVDWKVSEQLGQIIVTISDDMSVRVYQKKEGQFKLERLYFTEFIRLWHTLTYMRFDEKRNYIMVTAQNGFLFVIDLVKDCFVFASQIHVEGIEGISFDGENALTCSSDCSISHVRFVH